MNVFEEHPEIYQFFLKRWNEIETVVEYDDLWETELPPEHLKHAEALMGAEMITNSYAGILHDPVITSMRPGEMAKTMDDYGRKFIFIQTRLGSVVIAVTSKDIHKGYLSIMRDRRLRLLNPHPPEITSDNDLATYLGSPGGVNSVNTTVHFNFGEQLENIYALFSNPHYKTRSLFIKSV